MEDAGSDRTMDQATKKKVKLNRSLFVRVTGYKRGSPFCSDCKTTLATIHRDLVEPEKDLEWWFNTNPRSKIRVLCLDCMSARLRARDEFWKSRKGIEDARGNKTILEIIKRDFAEVGAEGGEANG